MMYILYENETFIYDGSLYIHREKSSTKEFKSLKTYEKEWMDQLDKI